MWYSYYAYYYKDASQNYYGQTSTNGSIGPNANRPAGFSYNNRDIYDGERAVNDWGYIGESYNDGTTTGGGKPPFFRDITVYGFNQHKFVQYTLVNPMITEWNHDTYDYSADNGVMENAMTIQYETVKYYTGAVGAVRPDTNVQGFADPNYYDQRRSSLSRPGGTASIIGQGGLLDTGIGIFEDLQTGSPASLIGAVQKAGATYNTFKGKNIRSIVNAEAVAGVTQVLTNTIPGAVRAQPNGTNSIAQRLQAPLFPTPPKKS
jgi:hypothetical protein